MENNEMWRAVNAWFPDAARDLPWRDPRVSSWGILVSEFMLQQTQVDRVLPRWLSWIERWPDPGALAAAEPGDAVRAWDRLGYPRRALWLHRAAVEITEAHGGVVPDDVDTLLALTGVGPYTARAVAAFAYGRRHPVVDTNTRRVIARAVHGRAAAGLPATADLTDMEQLLPLPEPAARVFNAGMMELGAIVCTAKSPRCDVCPLAGVCEWRGSGYPDNAPSKRPKQAKFAGSDRQVRGRIMALLRHATAPVSRTDALRAGVTGDVTAVRGAATTVPQTEPAQAVRALDSLIADGLVIESETGFTLP